MILFYSMTIRYLKIKKLIRAVLKCCSCMSNGVCERCSSVKAGSQCSDCYPGRMGLCRNLKTTSENALLTSNSLTQNHCYSVLSLKSIPLLSLFPLTLRLIPSVRLICPI